MKSITAMPNAVFLIPEPKPGDQRERNAFGILTGFGRAYAEYYRKRDETAKVTVEGGAIWAR